MHPSSASKPRTSPSARQKLVQLRRPTNPDEIFLMVTRHAIGGGAFGGAHRPQKSDVRAMRQAPHRSSLEPVLTARLQFRARPHRSSCISVSSREGVVHQRVVRICVSAGATSTMGDRVAKTTVFAQLFARRGRGRPRTAAKGYCVCTVVCAARTRATAHGCKRYCVCTVVCAARTRATVHDRKRYCVCTVRTVVCAARTQATAHDCKKVLCTHSCLRGANRVRAPLRHRGGAANCGDPLRRCDGQAELRGARDFTRRRR